MQELSPWLEGAEQHFFIWRDHKIFFPLEDSTPFSLARLFLWDGSISTAPYCSGYSNTKPDTLLFTVHSSRCWNYTLTCCKPLSWLPWSYCQSQIWLLSSLKWPDRMFQLGFRNCPLFASHYSASWSSFLPRIKYAHSYMVNSSTGMSPFVVPQWFQSQFFSGDRGVCSIWPGQNTFLFVALLHSSALIRESADHCHLLVPKYWLGQKLWLSSKDLPL